MYNIQGPENLEVIIAFLKVIKEKKQKVQNKEETQHVAGEGRREINIGMRSKIGTEKMREKLWMMTEQNQRRRAEGRILAQTQILRNTWVWFV